MSAGRDTVEVAAAQLGERAGILLAQGFRLTLIAAHEDADATRVVYLFTAGPPDRRVELVLRTDRDAPQVPSLAALSFPAGRFEREMRDLHGVVPRAHPLPRRLVRHQHWPVGWYPMRADAGPPPPFGSTDEPFPFLTVEGPGVYEIPVGPVHAGVIEPGHFRFSVVGETILKLKARLWFTHKGVEKLVETRTPDEAFPVAERVSGDTTVGHALAFCLAVEDALDWPVPAEAQLLRAVLLELERLYNHVSDLGALCNDVGFAIVQAHTARLREQLVRRNADVAGHRLLRGGVVLGGADVHQLPDPAALAAVAAEVREIVELALGNTIVRDRFAGTAVLTEQQVRDIGCLGYVARASGLDVDARRAHPFCARTAEVPGVVRTDGDVLARFLLRAEEVAQSTALLAGLLSGARAGDIRTPAPSRPAGHPSSGVGLVEGWRGTIAHRLEIGTDGRLTRLKVADPSFFNWPALPASLAETIVPDFPLVNKSFNLSYAGNDL